MHRQVEKASARIGTSFLTPSALVAHCRWHVIKGNTIDVKRAKYIKELASMQNIHDHKLFVTNLDAEVRRSKLRRTR